MNDTDNKQLKEFGQDLFAKFLARIPGIRIECTETEYLIPILWEQYMDFFNRYRGSEWFAEHVAAFNNESRDPLDLKKLRREKPRIWVWHGHRGFRLVKRGMDGEIEYADPVGKHPLDGAEVKTMDYTSAVEFIQKFLGNDCNERIRGRDLFIFIHQQPEFGQRGGKMPPLFLEELLTNLSTSEGPIRVIMTGAVGTLPELNASFISSMDFPFPDERSVRKGCARAIQAVAGLEKFKNIGPENVDQRLVDNMRGLSWRRLEIVAREVAIRMSDPEAAYAYALKAKMDALKSIAPHVTLIPAPIEEPRHIGLEHPKALIESVVHALDNPEIGVTPAVSILLAGPPGTGKSFLVEYIAWLTGAMIFRVDSGQEMDSLLGESEKRKAATHQLAKALGKIIYFTDEVEKMWTHQGARSDGGVGSRLLASELEFRQDVFNQRLPIIIVDTANLENLNTLPPAHYARYTHPFYVGFPSSDALGEIVKAHLMKIDPDLEEGGYAFDEITKALVTGFGSVKNLKGKTISTDRKAVGRDVAQVLADAELAASAHGRKTPTQEEILTSIERIRSSMIALDSEGQVLALRADDIKEEHQKQVPRNSSPGSMQLLNN